MNYLRKKLQGLRMCADFRGYLREVTGYPLTLTDCMGSDLVSLSVTGNAVQDGTPSPDAPVEVQGVGERTRNLFDSSTLVPGRSIRCGGAGSPWNYDTSSLKMSTEKIYIKPNTKYTLITYNNDVYWRDRIIEANADDICTVNHSQYTNDSSYDPGKNIRIYPFTTNADTDYMIVRFQRVDCTDITNADTYDLRCMLLEGSHTAETIPRYEPYGYKVPVEVGGINLFNLIGRTEVQLNGGPNAAKEIPDNSILLNVSSNGFNYPGSLTSYSVDDNCVTIVPSNNAGYGLGFSFSVAEGDTYTMSYSADALAEVYASFYDAEGIYLSRSASKQITVPPNAVMMVITTSKKYESHNDNIGIPISVTNLMLVKGTYTADTMPAYEPYHEPQEFAVYLPQQIAKVGDVADEVVVDMEAKTAELRKNVGSVETDCASVVSLNDNRITLQCRNSRLSSGLHQSAEHTEMLNKYFPYIPNSNVDTEGVGPNMAGAMYQTYVRINKSRIDITEEDTLETLADKCQAFLNTLNEPKTYYVLATPTTTDISALQDWDAMPSTWRGTVTISADTTIPPSSMTAKYYATKKED